MMIFLFDFYYHSVIHYNHLNDVIVDQNDHLLLMYYYFVNYYLFDDYCNEMNLNMYMDDIDQNKHVDQDIHSDHNQLKMV
jgi:hypothetical protein